MIAWHNTTWIAEGARVRLTDRPDGEVIAEYPNLGGARLLGGARGIVVKAPWGGSPAYPCPDHDEGLDDCACGRESGIVPASIPAATVEWELDDGQTRRALIRYPGCGGRDWELVDDSGLAQVVR